MPAAMRLQRVYVYRGCPKASVHKLLTQNLHKNKPLRMASKFTKG
jgi:hypothetical protein